MEFAYELIGLILCIRLVLQSHVRPAIAATCYAIGFVILWPLLEQPWPAGIVRAVVSFGLTYIYLTGLTRLDGWRFWAFLLLGWGVLHLTHFTETEICLLFGIKLQPS